MKNKKLVFWTFWLTTFSLGSAFAQQVEVLYTKSGLDQAMEYKEALKVDKVKASNALSLMNVSEARENAYLDQLSGFSAVIVLGESGLKAVGPIHFVLPVIIVNALESTSAKGPVIRVLESDFKGTAPSSAKTVSNSGTFKLAAADLKDGKETTIKCEGISSADLVNKLISEIVRIRK